MEDRTEVIEKAIKDITEALFSGKAILEGDLRLILEKSIDDVWNAGRRHAEVCDGLCWQTNHQKKQKKGSVARAYEKAVPRFSTIMGDMGDNGRPETVVDVGFLNRQIEAYNADRLPRIIYQLPGESVEELAKKIREYGDSRGF